MVFFSRSNVLLDLQKYFRENKTYLRKIKLHIRVTHRVFNIIARVPMCRITFRISENSNLRDRKIICITVTKRLRNFICLGFITYYGLISLRLELKRAHK